MSETDKSIVFEFPVLKNVTAPKDELRPGSVDHAHVVVPRQPLGVQPALHLANPEPNKGQFYVLIRTWINIK